MTLQDINSISKRYSQEMKSLTIPLQKFGINYFTMQTVTNDGLWKMLATHPDWLDHSADEKYYAFDPTLINPKHYQSCVVHVPTECDDEQLNRMQQDALRNYNIDHCLAIIQKHTYGCDFYFLAAPKENKNMLNIYLTHLSGILRYIEHFKMQANKLIRAADEYSVNIAALKQNNYDHPHLIFNASLETPASGNLSDLTPREKDCLPLLIQGKTSKEIAIDLGISSRTVEIHIKSIKLKLNCSSKRDLEQFWF